MSFCGRALIGFVLTFLLPGEVMSAEEITLGGSKVYRYEGHKSAFRTPEHEARHVDELTRYLEAFLGSSDEVWHEIVSDKVHIDVLPFPPTSDRPFWTFVTSGMSDLPMNVPKNVEIAGSDQYAEMVISLPAEWFPEEKLFADIQFNDDNYWPIALLKFLARFPHEYDTWLWSLHTLPNGDPAGAYAANTQLSGVMLFPPVTWPQEKRTFRRSDGSAVQFLAIYPIYDDEMKIKLSKGANTLLDLMEKANLTEILDPTRKSLTVKRGGLWGLFRK